MGPIGGSYKRLANDMTLHEYYAGEIIKSIIAAARPGLSIHVAAEREEMAFIASDLAARLVIRVEEDG